jgi:DNA-binding GntR family transcriptional regulator
LCDFIYNRKTPEKLAQLHNFADCIAPYKYTIEQEIDFHSCLVSIAGNRQVIQFREIVIKIFSGKTVRNIENLKKIPSTHHEICDVLENGTVEEFRNIMYQHFVNDCTANSNI